MLLTIKQVVTAVRSLLDDSTDPTVLTAIDALKAAEFMFNQSVTKESLRQVRLNLQRATLHLDCAGLHDYAGVINRQDNTVRAILKG